MSQGKIGNFGTTDNEGQKEKEEKCEYQRRGKLSVDRSKRLNLQK